MPGVESEYVEVYRGFGGVGAEVLALESNPDQASIIFGVISFCGRPEGGFEHLELDKTSPLGWPYLVIDQVLGSRDKARGFLSDAPQKVEKAA